ncbi:MAG: hypothetical protein ACETWK_08760, partial [Candidatus Aminicenantaceae bacterium]
MKTSRLTIACVLVLCLSFSSLLFAQEKQTEEEKKAYEMYKKAKMYIYQKDWGQAVEVLRKFAEAEAYRKSKYVDDSLYWLSYSLNRLSKSLGHVEQQLELRKQAIE